MKLKEKYAYKKLRKKVNAIKRIAEIPEINNIKRIGVIWQAEENEAFLYLKNYFAKKQIIFRSICVYQEKTQNETGSNDLTPEDLNWWGLPKPGKIDEFLSIDFDLLLNISLQQNLVLDYITALTHARFKIGWSENEDNYFDLNINIGKNKDALFLAEQQIFYLRQLNKKTV